MFRVFCETWDSTAPSLWGFGQRHDREGHDFSSWACPEQAKRAEGRRKPPRNRNRVLLALSYVRLRNLESRRATGVSSESWHSHRTKTSQPSSSSLFRFVLSRCLLRFSF